MGKWTKIFLLLAFTGCSVIGFMIKLPMGLRHIDKELHALFYFVAAAFLNLLLSSKNPGRHILIFACLALFGIGIEYAQEFSNRFFHATIHGRFDPEDVAANLKGLVAFSVLWLVYFFVMLVTKKEPAKSSLAQTEIVNDESIIADITGIEISIRPATKDDMEKLLAFEQGIVLAERPFDSTLKEGKIHYYDLLALIQSAEAEVVVAVAGGKLIGSGYAKIKTASDYLKHDRFSYLGFMYVDPAYRGRGVNRLILDALIHWSKQKGITEVRLEVYNKNTPALNAYLKAGFTPNLLEMRRNI